MGSGEPTPSFHEQIFIEPDCRPGPVLSARDTEVTRQMLSFPMEKKKKEINYVVNDL